MFYFSLHRHARKGTPLDAHQTFFFMDVLCVKLEDIGCVFYSNGRAKDGSVVKEKKKGCNQ